MNTKEVLDQIARSMVLSGSYKSKEAALRTLAVNYMETKISECKRTSDEYEKKHGKSFQDFTASLKGKATPELEEDWMEWKAAQLMREGWEKVLRELVEHATQT